MNCSSIVKEIEKRKYSKGAMDSPEALLSYADEVSLSGFSQMTDEINEKIENMKQDELESELEELEGAELEEQLLQPATMVIML
ncbi:hypothetical protein C5167_016417 [Papaver somniferum]|nr:hypothetical protein C5167_016417 [Papaver somniferum]